VLRDLKTMVFLVNQNMVCYCRAMDEKIKTNELNYRTTGMVAVALFPAFVVAIYVFGIQVIWLSLTCVVSCVLAEVLFQLIATKKVTIKDGTAAVTGLILSFALPANFPLWMAIIGGFTAIVVAKQLFGGSGNNFLNPAAAGIVFLQVSFTDQMNQFPYPLLAASIDGQAAASPIQIWMEGRIDEIPTNIEMFLGFVSGGMGEVSALALLIGAIFLWYKKVLSPITPFAFIGTVAISAWIIPGEDPIFHILAGGTLLAAIFMTGDRVTVPDTAVGKLIFGIGCGLLTMVIRMSGTPMDAAVFAVLFMNVVTPYIERIPKFMIKKRNKRLADVGRDQNEG
jgi:Na+-translocating ferredoxin:NAD+ oxidoreductase subunit D